MASKGDESLLLRALLNGATASAIASLLVDMTPEVRVRSVAGVKGSHIGVLFDRVVDRGQTRLCDIVPASTHSGTTVVYSGRNSMPLFSRFEKRFTRTADGLVFGYNFQPFPLVGAVTGPGYFVVDESESDKSKQREKGELLFDYTKEPPFEPPGWPEYRANTLLGSRFVFGEMIDRVRSVSEGVFVGSAFRKGVSANVFFTLARCM